MTAILSLLVFIISVFVCGALLSWPLYELTSHWSGYPLHKFQGHITQLLGLGGAMLYLSLNHMLDRQGAGFKTNNQPFLYQIGIGLLLGIIILLIIELMLFLLGLHEPDPDFTALHLAGTITVACISGLIVGVLEETIFRGAIQGVLMKHLHVAFAVFLSSLTYAALHFIKLPALPANTIPSWHSGLQLLADSFNKGYFIYNFDKFITLFLLGVLLGSLRVLKGNIALCIGVHAGLVMMMKISRKWADYIPGSDLEFLVNSTDHQLGLLASFVLVIFIGIIYYNRKSLCPANNTRDQYV